MNLYPKNAVKIVVEQPVLSDYSTVVPGQKLTNITRPSSGPISCGPVLTAFGDEYAITGIIKGGVNDKMVYVSMLEIANAFDLSVMRP